MRTGIVNRYFLRILAGLVLVMLSLTGEAQNDSASLRHRIIQFRAAMTDSVANLEGYLDDNLSYGHSNGWIETKPEFMKNLGRRLVYHSITEDSVRISVSNNIAHVRFVGDFDVTLDGKRNKFHLKVLEVWVKRKKDWKIFARQAIR